MSELLEKIMIGIVLILSVLIIIVIFNCVKSAIIRVDRMETEDRFEKIQEWPSNFVMYDKETKVQYYVTIGGITVLVDADGKPLLYEGD